MEKRNFFPVEVHRKWSMRDALLSAKSERMSICDALLDEETVFPGEAFHRDRPSMMRLTLFKTGGGRISPDVTESGLKDEGLRAADLYECLALARRCSELFGHVRPHNFPLFIFGETARLPVPKWGWPGDPEWDGVCVPVFHEHPGYPELPPLRLTKRTDYIGNIVVVAARL